MNSNVSINRRVFLSTWGEIFKRSFFTFWVLLSLSDEPLKSSEILQRVKALSIDTVTVTEQSFYRTLRRCADAGLIDIARTGNDRRHKSYVLTRHGKAVLSQFIAECILPFYASQVQAKVKELL